MTTAFESDSAIVGLTSSIDESVHVGREALVEVVEEPLGGVVVLQVECDINTLLHESGVLPPHNESIAGLTDDDPDFSDEVELARVAVFERQLKTGSGSSGTPWSELTGGASGNHKTLVAQLRSFLGDFFDHDKEMNAIVAQTASAEPSALVLLDDTKIRDALASLGPDALTFDETVDASGKYTNPVPKDRRNLATNLLSVRQVAQVLEAFAAMGVGSANSRVVRVTTPPFSQTSSLAVADVADDFSLAASAYVRHAELSDSGDRMLCVLDDAAAGGQRLVILGRAGGTWSVGHSVALGGNGNRTCHMSADGRRVVYSDFSVNWDGDVHVLQEDNGAWSRMTSGRGLYDPDQSKFDGRSMTDQPNNLMVVDVHISKDGDTVAVLQGHQIRRMYVYRWVGDTWTQMPVAPGHEDAMYSADIIFVSYREDVCELAADGNTILRTNWAYTDGTSADLGQARVFRYDDAEGWKQLGTSIVGTTLGERLGGAGHLASDRVVVTRAGMLSTYELLDGVWSHVAGADIVSDAPGRTVPRFSMTSDGSYLACTSYLHPEFGEGGYPRSVNIYAWQGTAWSLQTKTGYTSQTDHYVSISDSLQTLVYPDGTASDRSLDVGQFASSSSVSYAYKLHAGDSIIGETRIVDADAVDATKQYSQPIKVQIVQSGEGAFQPSDADTA